MPPTTAGNHSKSSDVMNIAVCDVKQIGEAVFDRIRGQFHSKHQCRFTEGEKHLGLSHFPFSIVVSDFNEVLVKN